MSITTSWKIEQLDAAPHENGLDTVVKVIHWRAIATDGTLSAGVYGTQTLESPEPGKFIAYGSLTQTQVESWLFSAMGDKVSQIENGLAKNIANQKAPAEVAPPLPWG